MRLGDQLYTVAAVAKAFKDGRCPLFHWLRVGIGNPVRLQTSASLATLAFGFFLTFKTISLSSMAATSGLVAEYFFTELISIIYTIHSAVERFLIDGFLNSS